jgi:hypothetical protein
MRISNIYISWFFEYFIAILTHQEINWAYRPERQIAPLSPTYLRPPTTQLNIMRMIIFSLAENEFLNDKC